MSNKPTDAQQFIEDIELLPDNPVRIGTFKA